MYIRSPRRKASPCEYKEPNECSKDWNCIWDYDDKECRKKSPPVLLGEYSGKPVFNPTPLNLSSIKNIYSFMSTDIIDMYYNSPETVIDNIQHGRVSEDEITRLLNYLPDEETWFTDCIVDMIIYDVNQGDFINILDQLSAIARSGHWNMIERILPHLSTSLKRYIFTQIVRGGHLKIIQHLVQDGVRFNDPIFLRIAAMNGHLEVVKYLISLNHYDDDYTLALEGAAGRGHLDVVKYLVSQGVNIHNNAMESAVEGGRLNVIQYLLSEGVEYTDRWLLLAARYGRLNAVKYFVELGGNVQADNNRAIQDAVANGDINMIKYLISAGADFRTNQILRLAIANGYLDVVKYLVHEGADIQTNRNDFLQLAAGRGHNNIVSFIMSL